MRLVRSGVVTLRVAVLLLIGATWYALSQRKEAVRERDRAIDGMINTQIAYENLAKAYGELAEIYTKKLMRRRQRLKFPPFDELRIADVSPLQQIAI